MRSIWARTFSKSHLGADVPIFGNVRAQKPQSEAGRRSAQLEHSDTAEEVAVPAGRCFECGHVICQ